ncbi:MAG: phosphoribosyl-ATP pyrophosphohydrolase [Sarcina sp.]
MKKYNKLVRDLIPQIIQSDGKICECEIANKEMHYRLLEDKLKEETGEFLQDKNLEELADIMEVIFALADNLGYSEDDLIKKRIEKRIERGGFKEGIVLKSVKDRK